MIQPFLKLKPNQKNAIETGQEYSVFPIDIKSNQILTRLFHECNQWQTKSYKIQNNYY